MNLESAPPPLAAPLVFGAVEIRPDERGLLLEGRPVAVGARAFDVLLALAERRGRVVSKHELMDVVWPKVVVEENNLQVQIWALRKALGPKAIATIPGRGYRFALAEAAPTPGPPGTNGDAGPDSQAAELGPSGAVAATQGTDSSPAPGNLPLRLPPLYGRGADVQTLRRLLDDHALVTIVGSGGIGKTRLAQAVAAELRHRHPQGAWMIELAALADPALVVPTIARQLRLALPGHGEPLAELAASLHSQQLLLVLDNCEHLLESLGELARTLLQAAPGVRLLATSQERLHVADEQLYRLEPLAVPDGAEALASAGEYGAVRLFAERARALDPGFRVEAGNLQAVVDICRQLDGIALAIELAAARVRLLGVEGLRARLGERLRMLTGGGRAAPARHQTLRAALDWSHRLLDDDERRVFRRLAVFAGGFSIDGVQRVASDAQVDEWAVLDHLSSLIDRSLVLADGAAEPRYSLLDTTRAYALEKLTEAGELELCLRRHAEATRDALQSAVRRRDLLRLGQEMHNVRVAFTWAVRPDGDAPTAVALATLPAVYLAVNGHVTESLERLQRVEPLADDHQLPPALAAQYWQWLGRLGIDGRLPISRCIDALARAQRMFRALGNARHEHACLRMRAEVLLSGGDLAGAEAALQAAEAMEGAATPVADRLRRLRVVGLLHDAAGRSEAALRVAGDAYAMAEAAGVWRYVAILLGDMAGMHLRGGSAAHAAQDYAALAEHARRRPHDGLTLSQALAGLAIAQALLGRVDEARRTALEALPLLRRSALFLARADLYAWLAAREGRLADAARLAGAAEAFLQRSEGARDAAERRLRDAVDTLLRGGLDERALETCLQDGAAADEDTLAALVREA